MRITGLFNRRNYVWYEQDYEELFTYKKQTLNSHAIYSLLRYVTEIGEK
jgi:hypothetical protein